MVYELEFGKSPKIAYKLNDKNLASKPIERCNVGFAQAIFQESTIAALVAYSDKFPFFKSTAKFLQTIGKWWDKSIGKRKRDLAKNAVSFANFETAVNLQKFAS